MTTTNPCPSLSAIKGISPAEFYVRVAKSGRHAIMVWVTEDKARKEHKGTHLIKRVRCVGITGDDYAEIPEVKAAVKAGLRPEPGPLPWGQWEDDMFPYVIRHEKDGAPRFYGRVYVADDHSPNTTYWVNGVEVTGDEYRAYLPDSKAKPRPREFGKPLVFAVPLDHFEQVG